MPRGLGLLLLLPAEAQRCRATRAAVLSPVGRVEGRTVVLRDRTFAEPEDAAAAQSACEACWELAHAALEPIGGCFDLSTAVDVNLPANGDYVARLRVRDRAGGGVVAEAESDFFAAPAAACEARLRARGGLATNYREAHEREGREYLTTEVGNVTERSETYVDHEASPLCYGTAGVDLPAVLGTASGARGVFGVDYSLNEFGHGDRVLLDFVLSRHRTDAGNIVEFGTGGGVTSLYLGMAAALRGFALDTFDVVDARSAGVLRAWLPSMNFHLADLGPGAERPETVDEALAAASVVLVDHVHRLEFCRDVVAALLRKRAIMLVHDYTPDMGPGPTPHAAWKDALAPLGFARFYRDYQHMLYSSLAVFARPADFDDFLAEGARAIAPD